MMEEPVTGQSSALAGCQHPTRLREYNSGFASAETVCVDCGQSFDNDREQELRAGAGAGSHRDASRHR